jgi:hypothetical protein
MSRKVFTAGEVLAAADVNSFLMDQTVMSFAGTAARGSAIPTPVEGMVTYLEDIDDIRTYNGSAWVSPHGLTHINTTSFSASTGFSINNIFSSAYDNYKVVTRITSSSIDGIAVNCRGRTGGVDYTSNNYRSGYTYYGVTNATGFSTATNQTETFFRLGYSSDGLGGGFETLILRPFLAQRTAINSHGVGSLAWENFTFINDTNSIDGLTIYPSSGNITGSITIYGLRN